MGAMTGTAFGVLDQAAIAASSVVLSVGAWDRISSGARTRRP
ncbi:MAG: hypothetical protein AAGA32_22360 [Pseudomonadota bacterium]